MARKSRGGRKSCRMVKMGKVGMRCKCGKKLAKSSRCGR
jgi:hypothetical protein